MKTFWQIGLLAIAICVFVNISLTYEVLAQDYAPEEILVKFKSLQEEDALQALRTNLNAVKIKKFQINDVYQLKLQPGASVESAVAAAYTDPNVEYAEPNYVLDINATPNDTSFSSLWGLHNTGQTGGTADSDIDATEAWNTITDASDSIIIAVIDTGVDYNHTDLVDNMWHNTDEIPSNGIDDDNNGYIDDYYGWDFAYNDNDPYDGHSHGTHCAGTIGAKGNNGYGVAGVTWNSKIMAVKFLSDGGSGYTSAAVSAIQYAVDNGAKILSNSWGGGGYSQSLKDAITASQNAGTLFVAAAGNSGSNNDSNPHYPSSYNNSNVIAVAATDHNDNLAYFSCYGLTSVDLAAPGVSILSTVPNNSFSSYSGTSMATPHISGICALVWSRFPELTNLQVKARLLSTVDTKAGLQGKMVSGGRVNLYKALIDGTDTTPPADVSDLRVTATTYKSAALAWTAVGNDNLTGTASSYDVRYSLEQINSSNFANATSATGAPVPSESGSSESFTIQGLSPSKTYYFAIKVLDGWGNSSDISNTASTTTGDYTLIYQDKIENGINGWTISGTDGNGGAALWHQSKKRFNSTTTSWYYGDEKQSNYDTGKRNYGYITSPIIDLTQATEADLLFSYWRKVESFYSAYDILSVEVSYDNGSTWESLWTISSTTASKEAWTSSEYISLTTGKNTQIRFKFDTRDSVANSYEGVYIDDIEIVGQEPADTTKPATIEDLSASKTNVTYVTLEWTATGDDGSTGKALYYDIRYSTSNINSAKWDDAEQAVGEPTPATADSTETFTITDLTPGTKYYFGIKAVDNAGNISDLSNVIDTTTLTSPTAVVAPDEMPLVTLLPDKTTTETLTIENTGGSPLDFSLTDIKVAGLDTTIIEATEIKEAEQKPEEAQTNVNAEYVENELLVKLKDSVRKAGLADAVLEELNSSVGALTIQEFDEIGVYVIQTNSELDINEVVNLYNEDENVEYAELNYILNAFATPNDPKFTDLYGLNNTGQTGGTADCDIDAPEAWDYWTGADNIIVAVIDTGVDYNHNDLAANMWTNPGEIKGNGIDDDGNGYIDDYYGYDFCNSDSDPLDDHSHGTHCSGTIGGEGNNSIGVAGVCWKTKIMALKFLSSGGSGYLSKAVEAIIYSANMGANISSNSWGGGGYSQALTDSIEYAKGKGQLFIAAAGNSANNSDVSPMYPAAYDNTNIISVAAVDHKDNLAYFSNYGSTTVDLGAPGVYIWSTTPNNSYAKFSGTSMATPHVAGAAALIWSQNTGLRHNQIKDKLLTTSDPISSLSGKTVSGGRLNIHNAVTKENDSTPPSAVTDLATTDKTFKSMTLVWTATGDDGNTGKATVYDLRYSKSEINADNFSSATQLSGEPTPKEAGNMESVTITALDYNTKYYFALKVMDNAANWSDISNIESGSTNTPTIVFQDDMEGGVSNWSAQSPWSQTDESSYEGSISWTDSAGDYYSDNLSISLTSDTIDLTDLASASLEFWHKYEFEENYDYGYIEISTDGGSNWIQIKAYTGSSTTWSKSIVDLTSYAGNSIKLRFKLVSDDTVNYDGWHIDNVTILGSATESGWLTPNITSGTVAAGESTTITFTYNTADIGPGSYSTTINISTNDPENLLITVPAFLIVEITPPTAPPEIDISTPANSTLFNTTSINISGTLDYPYSVVVVNGRTAVVSNSAFGVTINLAEGANTISAKATNSLGSSTTSIQVTLDTIQPDIAITEPNNNFKTAQHSITVNGTTSDNLQMSGVAVNSKNASLNGSSFSATAINIDEGSNTITAQATDSAGNTKTSSVVVIRDTTAPQITIASPTDGSTSLNSVIPVSGTVDDNEATVTINGSVVALSNGSFNKNISTSLGSNTITITAKDDLGNASSRSVTIIQAVGPRLQISPTSIPLVTLTQGQTTSKTVTITNNGDTELTFSVGASIDEDSLVYDSVVSNSEEREYYGDEVPSSPEVPEYHPSRLLLKFKDGTNSLESENIHTLVGAQTVKTYTEIGAQKVELLSNIDVKEAIAIYMESGIVEYAEPDYVVNAIATYPNDPSFSSLWGLHNTGQDGGTSDADIDAPSAWDVTTGSSSVIIAVIDTGIDDNHSDLSANMWTDSSGYHGYDFYNNDNYPYDDNGHGTHCSGTIAGKGNNGTGVTGVNWTVKLMAVKFLNSSGSGYLSDAVDSTIFAVNNGAHVLSNSWGGGGYSSSLYNAIMYAKDNNVLFVAAAGNSGGNNDSSPSYPASYSCSNIISVAATDRNDDLASFSCYGAASVDIGAPGVNILSSVPGGYDTYSGTSMATPHVSGVAGLLLAQDSSITVAQLKTRILSGADSISALSGKCVTGGRLNAAKSLQIANDRTAPARVTNLSVSSVTFQSVILAWTAPGDDGNSGTAASYTVRYSTSQITDSNWGSATNASGEPSPDSAGSTESFTASGLSESTRYYFAMKTTDDAGNISSISNCTGGITATSVVIFTDDMEEGTSNWSADSPWALVTDTYTSSSHSWHDSPSGNYSNYKSSKLTSTGIDLSGYDAAKLTFYHKYRLETYFDYGYLFISTNNGSTWSLLKTYNGHQTSWTKETIDISSYCGNSSTQVKLKFLISTDYSITYDGWHIDDVTIAASGTGLPWLTVSPQTGAISAGQSTNITLYFSSYVNAGSYIGSIGVASNDASVVSDPEISLSLEVNENPSLTWYLAEGCTTTIFDTYVLIVNPSTTEEADITSTLMKPDGSTVIDTFSIPPTTRHTIHLNQVVPNESVSTKIESTNYVPVTVERAMYFDSYNAEWAGGHATIATNILNDEWYFAEGSTGGSFDQYLLFMNPHSIGVDVRIIFMMTDGSTIDKYLYMQPTSRFTVYVNDIVDGSSSAKVIASNTIAAERAQYWSSGPYTWIGGHVSIGAIAPRTDWFLAEGATLGSFDEYVLMQNPNDAPTQVTTTFMKQDGSTIVRYITIPATARYTIKVNDVIDNEAVSVKLKSQEPIVAERAMYWDSESTIESNTQNLEWAGGHISKGSEQAGTSWSLAEGYTGGTFDTFVLIMNPGSQGANATITFMKEDGSTVTTTAYVQATSRYTIDASDYVPDESFSTTVTSNVPVIIERAMYWDVGDSHWLGGHNSIGSQTY